MMNLSITFVVALGLTHLAQHYEVPNDKKIEASAAARAAARIGDIRGSISHDEKPEILETKPEDSSQSPDKQSDLSPRPAWNPPKGEDEPMPPVVDNRTGKNLDTLTTSTVRKPRLKWEIFDADGNLIRRKGYWPYN